MGTCCGSLSLTRVLLRSFVPLTRLLYLIILSEWTLSPLLSWWLGSEQVEMNTGSIEPRTHTLQPEVPAQAWGCRSAWISQRQAPGTSRVGICASCVMNNDSTPLHCLPAPLTGHSLAQQEPLTPQVQIQEAPGEAAAA